VRERLIFSLRVVLANSPGEKMERTRSFIVGFTLLLASPALAQKGFNGAEPRAPEEDFGAPAFVAQQAIGDVMLEDYALLRVSKQPFLNQLKRIQAANASAYDSAVSWTGKNCVTPIKDQGATNMCWNFAATSALESSYCTNLGRIINAAEQSVMECTDVSVRIDRKLVSGNEMRAYDVMRGMGVEQEIFNRWNPNLIKSCNTTPVLFREYYGVDGVTVLKPNDTTKLPPVEDIKRGIVDNGAVTVMLYDTTAFDEWQPRVADAIVSTEDQIQIAKDSHFVHEIVITGWDDVRGAWRVKNSWNTGWGDHGFGWIVYNDKSLFPGNFTHVTPVTKRGAPDLSRVVIMMFERLVRIPSIWVANPRIQFPSSLGFPRQKQTLVEGAKFAISKSILGQAVVNAWPANIRSQLQ
jgi:cathepsin L